MTTLSSAHKYACSVLVNEPLAQDIWRMRFSCPELAQSMRPGQFFNLAVPGDPSNILRLPFSWSVSDPREGWVEFAYLLVGEGTRRMTTMIPGTASDLVGPAGNGWYIPQNTQHALVVGGGSGVVPLVALVHELTQHGVSCDFVEGAATQNRVIYEDAITHYGAHFYLSTDDGSRGVHGFSTQISQDLLASSAAYDVVYTCGPSPMMRAIAAQAHEARIPCQVSMEKLMACGFGACTTCLVDTKNGRKTCCTDGPVFDGEEVLW
ncbi:MAG: dihydroorotate dehydrogenase electron transfer subunit [Coriobacteriales bacterium]|nr:dihydroorotate dehydrogenase electron transfer subunit [Coriobacteriales bacterium]